MIPQYKPLMLDQYAEEVSEQIKSNWIGTGKTVTKFEHMFAEYVDSEHAIACSSGTAAVLIALYAVGVRAWNKVILPDYSFIAATNATRFLGAYPELIDIDRYTLSMDINKLNNYLYSSFSKDTIQAIVFINHNGYVGDDLDSVRDICDNEGIPLIEDSACALGQWHFDQHAGTCGDIGCFSFSVPKVLTTGSGGMLVTDNDDLANRCREIVDQGSTTWRQDGLHYNVGVNFKFNDILASLGIAQMKQLDKLFTNRMLVHEIYLNRGLNLHTFETDINNGTWMNILLDIDAQRICDILKEKGFQSKMYYKPIHECLGKPSDQFPESDYVYKSSLYLPSSPTLTIREVNTICDIILEVL